MFSTFLASREGPHPKNSTIKTRDFNSFRSFSFIPATWPQGKLCPVVDLFQFGNLGPLLLQSGNVSTWEYFIPTGMMLQWLERDQKDFLLNLITDNPFPPRIFHNSVTGSIWTLGSSWLGFGPCFGPFSLTSHPQKVWSCQAFKSLSCGGTGLKKPEMENIGNMQISKHLGNSGCSLFSVSWLDKCVRWLDRWAGSSFEISNYDQRDHPLGYNLGYQELIFMKNLQFWPCTLCSPPTTLSPVPSQASARPLTTQTIP